MDCSLRLCCLLVSAWVHQETDGQEKVKLGTFSLSLLPTRVDSRCDSLLKVTPPRGWSFPIDIGPCLDQSSVNAFSIHIAEKFRALLGRNKGEWILEWHLANILDENQNSKSE